MRKSYNGGDFYGDRSQLEFSASKIKLLSIFMALRAFAEIISREKVEFA